MRQANTRHRLPHSRRAACATGTPSSALLFSPSARLLKQSRSSSGGSWSQHAAMGSGGAGAQLPGWRRQRGGSCWAAKSGQKAALRAARVLEPGLQPLPWSTTAGVQGEVRTRPGGVAGPQRSGVLCRQRKRQLGLSEHRRCLCTLAATLALGAPLHGAPCARRLPHGLTVQSRLGALSTDTLIISNTSALLDSLQLREQQRLLPDMKFCAAIHAASADRHPWQQPPTRAAAG